MFQKCYLPDLKFYLGKLQNENFPHFVNFYGRVCFHCKKRHKKATQKYKNNTTPFDNFLLVNSLRLKVFYHKEIMGWVLFR